MKITAGHHYILQRERLTRQLTALECCFCRWRIHRGYLVRFMGAVGDRALHAEMRKRMLAHIRGSHSEARAS